MAVIQKISKNPRVPLIIDCALSILRDKGYGGLSMRQVANKAGISLSNLQFYFKNKDELLAGMIDFYFERCSALFDNHLDSVKSLQPTAQIRSIISWGLEGGEEIKEICKIFRELWAIASRNQNVRDHLEIYYKDYANKLTEVFSTASVDTGSLNKVVSLLLPYFEGYAILGPALPLERAQVHEVLVEFVLDELKVDLEKTEERILQ